MMLARTMTVALLAAVPAGAQYYPQPYPQQAPQQYPGYPQQGYPEQYPQYPQQNYPGQPYPGQTYPQQGYGYQVQPYGTNESAVGAIVDGLIGNRYAVGDRTAIRQCAWAAVQRAQTRAGPNAYGGYGYAMPNVRITAITAVEHRSRGTRVRGLLNTGVYGGQRYGYNGQGYGYGAGGAGDLSFRCDADYRGYVYDVRLDRIARPY